MGFVVTVIRFVFYESLVFILKTIADLRSLQRSINDFIVAIFDLGSDVIIAKNGQN